LRDLKTERYMSFSMSDGLITDEEKAFLDRLARNLEINEEEYKTILKDYKSHSIKANNAKYVTDKALELVHDSVDYDTFAEEIKTMNR